MANFLLLSNMYPSKKSPAFGTFVKNFEVEMIKLGNKIERIVITNDRKNISKIFSYIIFISHSFIKCLVSKNVYVHYVAHSLIPVYLASFFNRHMHLILNVHGDDILPRTNFVKFIEKNITRKMMNKADLVVVPSAFFKDILINKYKINDVKIYISPSGGVNLDLFNKKSISSKEKPYFNIGFISRIDEGKGWDLFLKAGNILKHEVDSNIRLVIGGSGAQKDMMNVMIKELHMDSFTDYIGYVKQEDLPEIFHSLDLFIFPTQLQESLGLIGVESMACGVPVVGSKIGGLTTYIKEDINGYLFSHTDLDELVEKVKKFHSLTVSKKSILIQNCIKTAKKFDSKIISKDLNRIISEVFY